MSKNILKIEELTQEQGEKIVKEIVGAWFARDNMKKSLHITHIKRILKEITVDNSHLQK